jgi:hypothetical protein
MYWALNGFSFLAQFFHWQMKLFLLEPTWSLFRCYKGQIITSLFLVPIARDRCIYFYLDKLILGVKFPNAIHPVTVGLVKFRLLLDVVLVDVTGAGAGCGFLEFTLELLNWWQIINIKNNFTFLKTNTLKITFENLLARCFFTAFFLALAASSASSMVDDTTLDEDKSSLACSSFGWTPNSGK